MSIQPITEGQKGFTSKKVEYTKMNNEYNPTNAGVKTGFLAGLGASSLLFYTQMKSLKSISGKKSLLSSFHEKNLSLNDIMPKSAERSKSIVNGLKKNLLLWGVGITAVATLLGKVVDVNVNLTKEKRADERAIHIS